jgi:hypothetical protein
VGQGDQMLEVLRQLAQTVVRHVHKLQTETFSYGSGNAYQGIAVCVQIAQLGTAANLIWELSDLVVRYVQTLQCC